MSRKLSESAGAEGSLEQSLALVAAIRRMEHALDVHSRGLSSREGVTMPQLLCLLAVVAADGLTSRAIAQRLFVSPSTLVGVIDRLESKGWIDRVRDPVDRRNVHIVASAAGRSVAERLPLPLGEAFQQRFEALSGRRRQDLIAAVETIADMMVPDDGASGT